MAGFKGKKRWGFDCGQCLQRTYCAICKGFSLRGINSYLLYACSMLSFFYVRVFVCVRTSARLRMSHVMRQHASSMTHPALSSPPNPDKH